MMKRLAPSVAVAALAVLIGCGGYQASRSGLQGRAVLHVAWPKAESRLIPASAQSLQVSILDKDGKVLKTAVVQRGVTTATISGLPYGDLGVLVKAFPTTNATGVAQAVGAGSVTVTEDLPGAVTVSLDSTVDTLALVPSPLTVVRGGTIPLLASAKDKDGAIVLLSTTSGSSALTEALTWTVEPADAATIVGAGPAVRLTQNLEGDATVKATLKVKDSGETVEATAPLHGLAPLTPAGLPSAGYPALGGDYGASGQGRGPAAAGTVGASLTVGTGAAFAVVGGDGTLYALSDAKLAAQGAAGWEVATGDTAYGLTLTDGGVLLLSRASGVEARMASDGSLAWTFKPASGNAYAVAVGRDGTVYVSADKLYALDGANGAVKWTSAVALAGTVAISDDGTLYGRSGAKVVAIDGAGGATKWSKSAFASDSVCSSPVVVGDTVYVKSGVNTKSTARPALLRDERDDLAIYGEPGDRPDVLPQITVAAGSTRTTGAMATTGIVPTTTYYTFVNLSALGASDGARKWTYAYARRTNTVRGTAIPSLTTVGGRVAVRAGSVYGEWNGVVSKIDAASGAGAWTYGSAGTTTYDGINLATASDGTVYGASSGGLQAVDADGKLRWNANVGTLGSSFALADDGTVYATTTAGKVVRVN